MNILRIHFKSVSIFISLVFAITQILPIGMVYASNDCINSALDNLKKKQAYEFGPDYAVQPSVNMIFEDNAKDGIAYKNDLENKAANDQPKAPDKENVSLKGPKGGGTQEGAVEIAQEVIDQGASQPSPDAQPVPQQIYDYLNGQHNFTGSYAIKYSNDTFKVFWVNDNQVKMQIFDKDGKALLQTDRVLGFSQYGIKLIDDKTTALSNGNIAVFWMEKIDPVQSASEGFIQACLNLRLAIVSSDGAILASHYLGRSEQVDSRVLSANLTSGGNLAVIWYDFEPNLAYTPASFYYYDVKNRIQMFDKDTGSALIASNNSSGHYFLSSNRNWRYSSVITKMEGGGLALVWLEDPGIGANSLKVEIFNEDGTKLFNGGLSIDKVYGNGWSWADSSSRVRIARTANGKIFIYYEGGNPYGVQVYIINKDGTQDKPDGYFFNSTNVNNVFISTDGTLSVYSVGSNRLIRQKLDSSGVLLQTQTSILKTTFGSATLERVVLMPDGSINVIWHDYNTTYPGGAESLKISRFAGDLAGGQQAVTTLYSSDRGGNFYSAMLLKDGKLALVWSTINSIMVNNNLRILYSLTLQIMNPDGTFIYRSLAENVGEVNYVKAELTPSGNLALFWYTREDIYSTSDYGSYNLQIFDKEGKGLISGGFKLPWGQYQNSAEGPKYSMLPSGTIIVQWLGGNTGTMSYSAGAQIFSEDGKAILPQQYYSMTSVTQKGNSDRQYLPEVQQISDNYFEFLWQEGNGSINSIKRAGFDKQGNRTNNTTPVLTRAQAGDQPRAFNAIINTANTRNYNPYQSLYRFLLQPNLLYDLKLSATGASDGVFNNRESGKKGLKAAFDIDALKTATGYKDLENNLRDDLNHNILIDAVRAQSAEAGLIDLINTLKDKKDKTEIETQVLEAAQMIVAEARYMDEDTMGEFEQAVQLITVAETMKDVVSEAGFREITESLADLVETQHRIYADYLSGTNQVYEQLQSLLNINVDKTDLPYEYSQLLNMSYETKRKILVDLAVETLKAKDAKSLTANERKVLLINMTVLQPLRNAYIQGLRNAISGFIASVRSAMKGKSPASIFSDNVSLKALFLLDRNNASAVR